MSRPRHWAVVPAAGVGRRMGTAVPKQYLPLAGRTVIEQTLDTLLKHPRIDGLVVILGADDAWWARVRPSTSKPLLRVDGGAERFQSVANGLMALREQADADDWVLVHDAVRPCLRGEDLDKLIDTLADDPVGGLLATPVRDTMKRADRAGRIDVTIDRANLWHALTPQMFRLGVLLSALIQARERKLEVTDDAAAVEALGLAPRLVEGHADNIKITRSEDLALAEFYLTHTRS